MELAETPLTTKVAATVPLQSELHQVNHKSPDKTDVILTRPSLPIAMDELVKLPPSGILVVLPEVQAALPHFSIATPDEAKGVVLPKETRANPSEPITIAGELSLVLLLMPALTDEVEQLGFVHCT
jgi:hypothetical protein